MRHLARYLVILGAVLAAPRFVAGQASMPAPGARVRVSAPDLKIFDLTGNLVHATADSLTIHTGAPPPLTIPIRLLSQLEVSHGRDLGLGLERGAKYGALFGGLLGLSYVVSRYGCKEYCALSLVLAGVGGAVGGIILGGVGGLVFPPERWQEVPLTPRSGASGMAGRHRTARVGLSIAF